MSNMNVQRELESLLDEHLSVVVTLFIAMVVISMFVLSIRFSKTLLKIDSNIGEPPIQLNEEQDKYSFILQMEAIKNNTKNHNIQIRFKNKLYYLNDFARVDVGCVFPTAYLEDTNILEVDTCP